VSSRIGLPDPDAAGPEISRHGNVSQSASRQNGSRQSAARPGVSRPGATRIVTTRTTIEPTAVAPVTAPRHPPRPPVTPSPRPPESARAGRRRDIQGLRALAVLAVIVDHVFRWPGGGFAGVDVFFVISGFLITGLLLREHEATGRISLRGFYANRMRRILPAAALVLAVTVTVGYALFNQTRALATAWDALASLLFVTNWRFTAVGTDYFSDSSTPSVLQHYWSLSVEEQFYLLWPALLIAVLLLATGRTRTPGRSRRAVAVLTIALVTASFGYALWLTAAAPTWAYFSTFARAWELGVGALLAVFLPALARLPLVARGVLGWVGLAGIVASFFVVSTALPFPGPWAALPVVATALVIAGGAGGEQRHLFPLTNRVSGYLGDISYSLYLWHYPVLVFLTLLLPERTVPTTLLILGTILAVSVVSYSLVEQPMHRSPWLRRGGRSRAERRSAWRYWRTAFSTQFILSATGAFVIVVVVAVSFHLNDRPTAGQAGPAGPVAPAASTAATAPPTTPTDESPSVRLQADLAAAAAATAWPDNLSPSLDRALAETSNTNPARDCFNPGDTPDLGRCTWGDDSAPNQMYLVGDSEALSYAPAFKAIAEASGGRWKITTVGLYGCRFTAVDVANDGAGVMAACPQRKSAVAAAIATDSPELVVVANAFALGQDTNRSPLSVADLVASTMTETAAYGAAGAVVHLAPPPLGAELGQCYSTVSSPQDCNTTVGPTWQEFAAATNAAASASGQYAVSSLGFSCAAGICPAFSGTIPTKYDTVHLTPAYAEHIAPVIRDELAALGLM
jgi:peptidoglycan/LPS O-acetylase OafA/YrhL